MIKEPVFAYWYRFKEIKRSLKTIGVGAVKNGCGHSGLSTQKLAVCQGIDGINWFLVCWCKFRKAQSYFNSFCIVVLKNVWSFRSLKFLYLKDKLINWADFLQCWYEFRKVKSYFNNYWEGMVRKWTRPCRSWGS